MTRIPWNKGKTGVYTPEQLEHIQIGTKKVMQTPAMREKMSNAQTGKIVSEQTKKKMSIQLIGNKHASGMTPWNKNKQMTNEYKYKSSLNNGGKNEIVGSTYYQKVHKWVRDNIVKKNICEHCSKKSKTEYANISQQYYLDKNDWFELCRQCHNSFDINVKKQLLESRG